MSEQEQNKSEPATPFKLAKAREKGNVARGADLGYFASLAAFLLFLGLAGVATAKKLLVVMRSDLSDFSPLRDPQGALAVLNRDAAVVLNILVGLATIVFVIVLTAEILQVRGFVFSAQPLKPDFSRLNPAKGFKRVFSLRTLKEAIKSVFKLIAYGVIATLAIRMAVTSSGAQPTNAGDLAALLWQAEFRLVAMFAAAALVFAAIDQVMARREFAKQMRMSRTEITREFKEREGEPRIKGRRKQLHAEFLKQTEGFGRLAGSDLVLVNPEHFAVALAYDRASTGAPVVRAKGRNRLALAMRQEALRLQIPVVADPPLARAIFRSTATSCEIAPANYRAVALHYSQLRSNTAPKG